MRGCPPSPRAPAALQAPPTSAWPPDVSVFPHFSHFKQGRCQSFPREVTRSAAEAQTVPHTQYKTLLWGHRAPPPTHSSLLQLPLPLVSPGAPGGPPRVSALCPISGGGGTSSPLRQSGQTGGGAGWYCWRRPGAPGAGAWVTRGAVRVGRAGRPSLGAEAGETLRTSSPGWAPGRGTGRRRPVPSAPGIAPRAPVSASVSA